MQKVSQDQKKLYSGIYKSVISILESNSQLYQSWKPKVSYIDPGDQKSVISILGNQKSVTFVY